MHFIELNDTSGKTCYICAEDIISILCNENEAMIQLKKGTISVPLTLITKLVKLVVHTTNGNLTHLYAE